MGGRDNAPSNTHPRQGYFEAAPLTLQANPQDSKRQATQYLEVEEETNWYGKAEMNGLGLKER